MKTKLITLYILSLLLSACGDKAEKSADAPAEQGGTRSDVLLTTEIPAELLE